MTDTEINLLNSGYVPPPTPPFTGLPFKMTHDPATNEMFFSMESHLEPLVKRIIEAEEKMTEGLLREAFEAGYERGADDEAYAARGVGPHTDRPDNFDDWLVEVKERLLG